MMTAMGGECQKVFGTVKKFEDILKYYIMLFKEFHDFENYYNRNRWYHL